MVFQDMPGFFLEIVEIEPAAARFPATIGIFQLSGKGEQRGDMRGAQVLPPSLRQSLETALQFLLHWAFLPPVAADAVGHPGQQRQGLAPFEG